MYINRNYGFWMTFNWSKNPFIVGACYAASITLVEYFFDWKVVIPWQPVSIIGIAVAFYLGFKNNSSYDRTWEARKIWGSIVNSSRTFGSAVIAFVRSRDSEEVSAIHQEMILRHLGWLTALRYQLRLSRKWEHTEDRIKGLYSPTICEEYYDQLDHEILQFIPKEEFEMYKHKSNISTQILLTQSKRLQELKNQGYLEDFRHMELYRLIQSFYEDQGKSERIKNFPFPRQYASVALWMTWVFALLIPFGMLQAFKDMGDGMLWLNVPFSALIIWVFLMEKIGDYSENPFEGTYNDVPITSISRTIEIDLKEMLDDATIPEPVAAVNDFLM